ncbi:GAD-like domain-containing protein [Rhizobium sp. WYJ-E13]|uniref:GAD-like domain-containing protein n=1 Tax=Rhizobium sp. WYJ-E13 TaxID=2849093 RepID=UPI001C1EE783|nr:GAD-like domain-containing protein [Rhizobium sp. WYJ-E13]QWW71202.1 DUF1851 domain-containing protein [Rhizobium sp. WYJ-E13]
MSAFEDFEKLYGPADDRIIPGAEQISAYADLLPEEILQAWRENGWCSYGDRLLWMVDPGQFSDIIGDLAEFEKGTPVVFVRSAFAHLYIWCDGAAYSFDVHHGSLSRVTDNIVVMFMLMCDEEVREKILRSSQYKRMAPALGPPDRDECYAFEPALQLGGSGADDTIRRVKIREHLGILSQI